MALINSSVCVRLYSVPFSLSSRVEGFGQVCYTYLKLSKPKSLLVYFVLISLSLSPLKPVITGFLKRKSLGISSLDAVSGYLKSSVPCLKAGPSFCRRFSLPFRMLRKVTCFLGEWESLTFPLNRQEGGVAGTLSVSESSETVVKFYFNLHYIHIHVNKN